MNDVEKFDKFFEENYDRLMNVCQGYGIEEDLLHDTYIKLQNFVKKNGYKNNGYYTYIVRSLINNHINALNSSNNRYIIYIDKELDFLNEVDEDEEDKNKYRRQYITYHLFNYLQNEIKCTEFELHLFKLYYLSSQRMTYKKIKEQYGIDKSKTSLIIKKIKKLLKNDFIVYLNERTLEDDKRRDDKYT